VALMRQAVLFISEHSKTESVFILAPLIELCCLENQDRQFSVKLIENLLRYDDFLEAGKVNVLTTKFLDILSMLSQFMASDGADDSLALAQISMKVMVSYIVRLEEALGEALLDAKQLLVDNILDALVHFREENKVVYIRFLELAVEIAVRSDGLAQ